MWPVWVCKQIIEWNCELLWEGDVERRDLVWYSDILAICWSWCLAHWDQGFWFVWSLGSRRLMLLWPSRLYTNYQYNLWLVTYIKRCAKHAQEKMRILTPLRCRHSFLNLQKVGLTRWVILSDSYKIVSVTFEKIEKQITCSSGSQWRAFPLGLCELLVDLPSLQKFREELFLHLSHTHLMVGAGCAPNLSRVVCCD